MSNDKKTKTPTNIEKIDLDTLTKGLKITDPDAFAYYLKEVYSDLYSRVTENKNDPKEKQVKSNGVTKNIFDKYYVLPGIIGDRLFHVLTKEDRDYIKLDEFTKGMKILFYEGFDKVSKFIFDFYDFDNDGKINKEDIRVVLSYITLEISPRINSTGKNISYYNRVNSQDELYNILKLCFNDIKGEYMNYEAFKNVVENVNSDIFLMIYLFLLENRPFTSANVDSYKYKKSSNQSGSAQPKVSPSKLIASPSKNTSFSPYKNIKKATKRKSVLLDLTKEDIHKILGESPSPSPKFRKRELKKKKTLEKESDLIKLQDTGEDDDEKKINEKRLKELTGKKGKSKKYNEDIQLKPAFKQTKDPKQLNNPINELANEGEEDDEGDFGFSSSEDEKSEDGNDDVLQFEGYLYKLVDKKMRKLWFKLVHKDLFYFKNKGDKSHKGMHNLSGLFFKEEKSVVQDGITYYCFSIVYPTKTRTYYCDNEKDYKTWVTKLKEATEYTNLLDIYEIKEKLGNGKFGLVKLGINKMTKEKVAIKIMDKSKMDTSDIGLVRTEIEILKICQHPNIIRLYDIFENVDYLYIIMEYCPGGDLFSYLEKRKFKISEERASIIMHKMCAAVYYIHKYGIVHRDLKPENVLMTSKEDDSDIRILDFGLSKMIGPNEKCTEPYGTLTYCAPEIIIDEPYTQAVDMWSLGVMTYLMLSGRLPFNAEDETDIARQVAFDEPDFTKHSCWSKISNEAKDFTKRLLEKKAKNRMDIKQALEHDWIKKYSKNEIIEDRKKNDGDKFMAYSSVSK